MFDTMLSSERLSDACMHNQWGKDENEIGKLRCGQDLSWKEIKEYS